MSTCWPATLMTAVLFLFSGCQAAEQSAPAGADTMTAPAPVDPDAITGVVIKTMDSGGYTYVLVGTGSDQVWAAGPAITVSPGDTVTFDGSMPMNGYYSKTLDQTFECVYFTGAIEVGARSAASLTSQAGASGRTTFRPSGSEPLPPKESTADDMGERR